MLETRRPKAPSSDVITQPSGTEIEYRFGWTNTVVVRAGTASHGDRTGVGVGDGVGVAVGSAVGTGVGVAVGVAVDTTVGVGDGVAPGPTATAGGEDDRRHNGDPEYQ